MLRLSIRKGESTWRFGPIQWGVVDGPDLTPTQASAMLDGKRACALIHGYNVGDPDDAYLRIASHITDCYDDIIAVHWPGSEWSAAFWLAQLRAPNAGKMISDALAPLNCAALDIEGHSLGCRVALEALLNGLRCRNLILAGAAVANESLALGERFGLCVTHTQRILVAYSRNDDVLDKAGRLGLFNVPLGLSGLEPGLKYLPHIYSVDCSATVPEHSKYKIDTMAFLPAWRAIA